MKKIVISLLSFMLLAPSVLAAEILTDFANRFEKNNIFTFYPINVEAATDGEINTEDGINIMLDPDEWILWHADSEVNLEGTAVYNGRVDEDAEITFLSGYKVMHIPVLEDFMAGEELEIQNMQVRTYEDKFDSHYLELDINGDFESDAVDINPYRVSDDPHPDGTIPYPVTDLTYVVAEDSVTLDWETPSDYDIKAMRVDKWFIKDEVETYKPKVFYDWQPGYTDVHLQDADAIRYKVTAEDFVGHVSDPVEVTVDLNEITPVEEPEEETEEEPEEESEEEPAEPEETEEEELARLLNYYNIRYSIKCMPSGVSVPENDSACLWARIDLIYAQQILGEEGGVAHLTDRDLELMEARRKWPELRYQTNCVETDEPADYCTSLGKALDRISYFLD